MRKSWICLSILTIIVFFISFQSVYAHQIDSVGNYRIQIGWMHEPAISSETNGIELFVNQIDPTLPADKQPFNEKTGISGLSKDLKIELVYKTETIILPLFEDHNIQGKYYTLVDPTVSGYYQVNILGKIKDTPVSKALHLPKVDDRAFIEFPEKQNQELFSGQEALDQKTLQINSTLYEKINLINDNLSGIQYAIYIGIVLGIVGIVIGLFAIIRTR